MRLPLVQHITKECLGQLVTSPRWTTADASMPHYKLAPAIPLRRKSICLVAHLVLPISIFRNAQLAASATATSMIAPIS